MSVLILNTGKSSNKYLHSHTTGEKMEKKKFVIAGAGFRGFCDAIELAKIPNSEVVIIDPAPFFGGLMYSLDINGFAVDKGVHMFDSIPKPLAEIVTEIMDGKVNEVEFVSMSAYNGKVTDGFSLPDLNSLDDEETKTKIKTELVELAKIIKDLPAPTNLHETFNQRYGKTAGDIFAEIFEKVYGLQANECEPNAIAQTSMGRLKFLDDPEMVELKKSEEYLDSVLAARRKSMGKIDDYVSIYPVDGDAMKGWCDRAQKWLEDQGIKVLLNEKIQKIIDSDDKVTVVTDKQSLEAEKVLWSNDNIEALGNALGFDATDVKKYQHGTPMLFITMMTDKSKIRDFTYLQNFDLEAMTYRTASAGIFSKQDKDGISFITSECPVVVGSEDWENPEKAISKAWEEVKKLRIIAEDAELTDSHVMRVPSSFKLAKLNYTEKVAEFNKKVRDRTRKVILRNVVPFFRRDIYLDSLKIRDLI